MSNPDVKHARTPRTITIRLVCRSLPHIAPDEEDFAIGLQDQDQQIHVGKKLKNDAVSFQCAVSVKSDPKTGGPVFSGPFIHGTPASKFIYLSWKCIKKTEHPWLQRIKIPVVGLTWKLIEQGDTLEADITDRKPHATDLIVWKSIRAIKKAR